ncbi:unnamed protein product [Allacma fusca]|uniref:Peptidase S1 domain-containing protein n=1 Tax=Allacma fusca TaxID=39272 RepID=A0A8J2KIL7_9HEXA|nr:unnamed protein product [Allacma fusca]
MKSVITTVFFLFGAVSALPPKPQDDSFRTQFSTVSELSPPGVLIVGGRDALPGEFPWQVSLQMLNESSGERVHICGGTLIDEIHVVSAAHCNRDDYEVVIGATNLKTAEPSQQRIPARHFEPHPDYDDDLICNDVSVITLSRPVVFNDKVKPLRLARPGVNPEGQLCVNTGWGNRNPIGEVIYPDVLQAVNLTIINQKDCERRFKDFIVQVDETMICGHDLAGGKGACGRDSGGPLVCSDSNGPYLAGIVSWGNTPCGQIEYASVYARVTTALDFINRAIVRP